jgi:hypothetical protein
MDSNPEEFVPDVIGNYPAKWRNILRQVEHRIKTKGYKPKVDEIHITELPFLKDEEVEALWDKLQSLQADLFTKKVMNTLLQDADEELSSFSDSQQARGKKFSFTLSELEAAKRIGVPLTDLVKLKSATK